MNKKRIIDILEALAAGKHPQTGAPLPDESILHDPEVMRALYFATVQLKAQGKTPAPGGYKRWTEAEERVLVEGFRAGKTPSQLAHRHGRTEDAVIARLLLLNEIC